MRIYAMPVALAIAFGFLTATTAGASPPVHIGPGDLPPDVFTAINPCTGEEHEVTVTPTSGVIREGQSPGGEAGGHHVMISLRGTVTTSDGYSGKSTFHITDNGEGVPGGATEERGMFAQVVNQLLFNASGQAINVHLSGHLVIVDGEVVVDFAHVSVDCVGRPR